MRRRSANDHVRVLVTMTIVQTMKEVQWLGEAVADPQAHEKDRDIHYLLTLQLP